MWLKRVIEFFTGKDEWAALLAREIEREAPLTRKAGKAEREVLRCSFCGKPQNEVKKLMAGPTVYICNECNDICNEIMEDATVGDKKKVVEDLRRLTFQAATQHLATLDMHEIQNKIHELANRLRSRRREQPGDRIAGYNIIRVVGAGNFATVWEGHNRYGGKSERAAIKIFDLSKLTIGLMLWRFGRGIKAMQHLTNLAKIAPRSVVTIFNVSEDGLAFSMPYLPGGDLQNINRLGWSDSKKLEVFREICRAAAFAHSQGVIHRDIKPANIVLAEDGSPVLTDFDIAEIKFAATESVHSGGLGTPQFAAPEQLVGINLEAKPAADTYSLGKLLYYLMTETPPPLGSTDSETVPNYLRSINDERLGRLVYRAIQYEPDRRYQSVEELLSDLNQAKPIAHPPAAAERIINVKADELVREDDADAPCPRPFRSQVFISYSHKDHAWLRRLETHLKPLVQSNKLSIWSDNKINPGDDWQQEIQAALNSARVAILLVSPNFLASDFISNYELLPMLEAAKHSKLIIIWIAISSSMYQETGLVRLQAINNPQEPLDSLNESRLNEELVRICTKIKDLLS